MGTASPFAPRAAAAAAMVVAGLAASLADSKPAHAQDATGAVYSDLKAIIEDLLTAEVAKSLVPNIVCRTGRNAPESADDPAAIKFSNKAWSFHILRHYPQSLTMVYRREFSSLQTSLITEVSQHAGFMVYQALKADRTKPALEVPESVAKASGVPEPKESNTYDPLAEAEILSCVEAVGGAFGDDRFLEPKYLLDEVCPSNTHDYACQVAFSVRALLQSKRSLAEEHLLRAVATVVADRAIGAASLQKYRAKSIERTLVATRDFFENPKQSWEDYVKLLAKELAGLDKSFDKATIETQLKTALEAVEQLRTQWHVATNGGETRVDLSTLVDILTGEGGALLELCEGDQSPTCGFVRNQRELLSSGHLLQMLVRNIGRSQLREVARMIATSVFAARETEKCGKPPSEACQRTALYRRFVGSVVAYVVDMAQEKAPSDGTRAALRAAAVEVIQDLAKGGGIQRTTTWNYGVYYVLPWAYPRLPVLLPDLALRLSWSGGYLNESGSGARYVASANLFNIRAQLYKYTSTSYSALEISFIDPLAPLTELAVRKRTGVSHEHQERMVWNLITPRIDLLFGVPALSQKLVVAAGISLRIVSPVLLPPAATPATPAGAQPATALVPMDYRYLWDDGGKRIPSHLEFGFAVKYLL